MITFFVLLVAAVLIGLFAESNSTRVIGISIVAAIAVLVGGYLYWRDTATSVSRQARPTVPAQTRVPGQALTELSPSDIAIAGINLESGVETYWGIDGKQYQRPNLETWTLSGKVRNISRDHRVKDVALKVQLYSCPSYFTTPVAAIKFEELSLICSRIGERSVGLYGLDLPPQAEKTFSEPVSFPNQGEAINWRFWVAVARVVAQPL
ncbi:MAG TPA: hypothetical protein VKA79_05075 [Aestuariivirgaceae bacterium]|nr:hypothetical protein [Aestuariivirgaceae bacterium]